MEQAATRPHPKFRSANNEKTNEQNYNHAKQQNKLQQNRNQAKHKKQKPMIHARNKEGSLVSLRTPSDRKSDIMGQTK